MIKEFATLAVPLQRFHSWIHDRDFLQELFEVGKILFTARNYIICVEVEGVLDCCGIYCGPSISKYVS